MIEHFRMIAGFCASQLNIAASDVYRRSFAAAALLLLGLVATPAFPQADFYQDKTLTIIQDSSPGGVGHLRTNAVISALKKHVPGNPNIVIQFMPGGGGIKAANYLYNNVRRDGLTIARIGSGTVANAVLGRRGVKYDLDKFIFLGSGHSRGSTLFFTRKALGSDSLAKLKASSGVRIGGQSVGHSNYVAARLFAWLFDLKEPKFVVGYSGAEMDLALQQGELDARANSADAVVQRTPYFIDDALVDFHGLIEVPAGYRHEHPAFVPLPALNDLATTERQKRVVQMYVSFMEVLHTFVLPPDVPAERVNILRDAFAKVWKDPEFHETWYKMTSGKASPLLAEELEVKIKAIPREPADLELYDALSGPGPLPKR